MAVTSFVYGKAMQTLVNKEWDFDTDDIVCALASSAYTPDQDTHDYADDITDELSGGGYARVTLTTKTVGYTAGTNVLKLDADDVTFTAFTAADIRYAVFFADTGADSVSPLLLYVDFGATLTATSQSLVVELSADGLMTFTVA